MVHSGAVKLGDRSPSGGSAYGSAGSISRMVPADRPCGRGGRWGATPTPFWKIWGPPHASMRPRHELLQTMQPIAAVSITSSALKKPLLTVWSTIAPAPAAPANAPMAPAAMAISSAPMRPRRGERANTRVDRRGAPSPSTDRPDPPPSAVPGVAE